MSTVTSRLSLIHQATVQRDAAAAAGWGDPQPPNWQDHITGLACRAWTETGREVADNGATVVFEDNRLICPLGTDVTEKDRIGDVTYRGAAILPGPFQIRAVIVQRDFLELVLTRLQ